MPPIGWMPEPSDIDLTGLASNDITNHGKFASGDVVGAIGEFHHRYPAVVLATMSGPESEPPRTVP